MRFTGALGLQWLGAEAVLQIQPRESALQLGYFKPQNVHLYTAGKKDYEFE